MRGVTRRAWHVGRSSSARRPVASLPAPLRGIASASLAPACSAWLGRRPPRKAPALDALCCLGNAPAPPHCSEVPLQSPILVEGVRVTFLDANHCPGAVMILFEPPGRRPVLHTGGHRGGRQGLGGCKHRTLWWGFTGRAGRMAGSAAVICTAARGGLRTPAWAWREQRCVPPGSVQAPGDPPDPCR